MARIIPTDDLPGAREAGTVDFVDRYLSGIDYIYAKPDGSGFESLSGRSAAAWQRRVDLARQKYVDGVRELDRSGPGAGRRGLRRVDRDPAGPDPDRTRAAASRAGPELAKPAVPYGIEPALQQTSAESELDFFPLLVTHTRQGFLADPIYGGNRDRIGWQVIGFPGPGFAGRGSFRPLHHPGLLRRRPPPPNRPARPGGLIMSTPVRKPERVDVCIIGAGASGATAAQGADRARRRVVALEKGPWRTKETFGGDELANVNRYNLWPDPVLNPRTVRTTADEQAREELFCPVPQMVGGGTVHWQGWLPRFTPERLPPAQHRRRAARHHARRLADQLRRARAVLHQGRVGVRRLRPGRRQRVRGPAQPGLPVPADAAVPLRRRSSTRAARIWAGTPSRPRRPRCRGPSTAARRPWSAPSPSSTATRPAPARARSTCSSRTRWPPAATTCGRNATSASWCWTAEGKVKGRGLPGRRRRHRRAGGRRVHPRLRRGRVRAAAAPVASPAASPTASPTAATWSGATSPSTSIQRRGRHVSTTRSMPGPAAAMSARARFQFYEHDARRGFVSGGHIAAAGVGIPLPINWRLPGRRPGEPRPRRSTASYFNHCMAVAMVLHDMPQHDNRVDLDDDGRRRLGAPGRADHAEAARERPGPGPVPGRPLRRHPRSGRCQRQWTRSMPTG